VTPPEGASPRGRSVARAAVRPRPDEAEGLTILVFDQIGVERSVKARIVELDPEIVATLIGLLGPSGSDFDAADKDAVAGSVFAAGAGVGNDADVLGLERKGDDLAAVVVAGLLEGSDGSHCRSPTGLPKSPLATSIAVMRRRSGRLHPNGTEALAQDGESRACCPARNAAQLQGKKFGEAVADQDRLASDPPEERSQGTTSGHRSRENDDSNGPVIVSRHCWQI